MPIFEFDCQACGRRTTALVLSRDRVNEVRCSRCGSDKLSKLFSRFATPRSEEARLESLARPESFAGVDESDPRSVSRWMKRMGDEVGEDLGSAFEEEMAAGGGEEPPPESGEQ